MARVLGRTLLGLVVGIVTSGVTTAQNETFREGVKAFRLGRYDEAKQKLEAVLAADPSNAQALEIWQKTDQAEWTALLLDEGEVGKIAQHLLVLARHGTVERSRDAESIRTLVDQATSGDYAQRSKATRELIAQHGEFAVPALVDKLGNADDEQGQIYAIVALYHLNRAATLPLIETLESDNALARRNAAAALAQIKDERAAAPLAVLAARDAQDSVRETAQAGLRGLAEDAGTTHPVQLYLRDANRYLTSGVRSGDESSVVWSWQDGALNAVDVPGAVYPFELAKQAAHDALHLDPSSDDAKVLLAGAYLGEAATITDSLAANPDDEALQAMAAQVPALEMAAAATGVGIVRRAVADAIRTGAVPVAVAGIELLGELESRDDLASSPLVAAVSSNDSRIGYAAALALAEASAGSTIPAADLVVRRLSQAVTEETLLFIHVIDGNPATQRAVQEAAFKQGVQPTIAESGARAWGQLNRFPNVDVVVISETLPDARPEAIIGLIRKDPRLAGTKILVLASDAAAATELFGDRVDGVIQGPVSGEELKKAVTDALAGVEPDQKRARADRVAIAASAALSDLAARRVDVGDALANLAAQLGRADSVAIPAARAIGDGGGLAQIAPLLEALQSDGASLELKTAAADAVGGILSRSAGVGEDLFTRLVAIVESDADATLRGAVVRALGKAQLSAEQKAALLDKLRVRPGAGTAPVSNGG